MKTRERVAAKRELDLTQAEKAFSETIARVVDGREQVVLTRDGTAVAAIVPVEDLWLLKDLQRQRLLEFTAADRTGSERGEAVISSSPPKVPSDQEWRQRFRAVIARIQSHLSPDITPEEIEADINEAINEVRSKRRARRY